MDYSLNFTDITPELFKLSPGARQQGSAAHHAGRQEQGGDRVLNASHRGSPCVSLDRQPTGQSHQVAEIQSALADLLEEWQGINRALNRLMRKAA